MDVTISGTPEVGQTLTANVTGSSGTVTYQWQVEEPETAVTLVAAPPPRVYDIVESNNLLVTPGLELLDDDDRFVEDISGSLMDGTVERGMFQTIHGTCRLRITKRLDWGRARVKPYIVLSDGARSERFDLGVFLLSTPKRVAGAEPTVWDVEGYDKLLILNSPVGRTYTVPGNEGIFAWVKNALTEAGQTRYFIAESSLDPANTKMRTWPITGADGGEAPTWLRVINDLLDSVGYRGLWVDRDGVFRSEPYKSPSEQPTMFTYRAQDERTIVGEDRVEEFDFFDAPNRIVVYRDDPALGLPVTGDGLVVVENTSDGPTSFNARGRWITRVEPSGAVTQAALLAKANEFAENAKRILRHVDLTVGPNPRHFHFDVVRYVDPELTADNRFLVQGWSLPLDGGWMRLRLRQV